MATPRRTRPARPLPTATSPSLGSAGTAWRTAKFLTADEPLPAGDELHLYCPGGRDLPQRHLITLALLPIHDWNAALLEEAVGRPFGSAESVSACVLAIDPFRRLRDLLLELKRKDFHWVTNFPSIEAIDGEMRATLEDLGFGLHRELQFIEHASAMGFSVAAFATTTSAAAMMVKSGAAAVVTPDGSAIDAAKLSAEVPIIELEAV